MSTSYATNTVPPPPDTIAGGTPGRFCRLPSDNLRGNFVKVTQLVPTTRRLALKVGGA